MKTFKLPKRPLLAALFLLPPKLRSPLKKRPFGAIFGKNLYFFTILVYDKKYCVPRGGAFFDPHPLRSIKLTEKGPRT